MGVHYTEGIFGLVFTKETTGKEHVHKKEKD